MQTIKPHALGFTTRCIEYRRRIGLSVTAAVYFPFKPAGEGTAWTEMSMWNFLAQEMPEGPMIDEGVVKLRSEFLVRGSAFPPNGAAPGCEVSVKVGPVEKRLHVFGTRIWHGRDVSAPQPFDRMPIDWQHTWGAANVAANPLGMGAVPIEMNGVQVQLLPHVELPQHPLTRPDQVGQPASFGMVDMTWPQRAQYRGTYDEAWFKEQSPGFADDIDWRHFNLAQPDQWFDTPLKGDEPFAFRNMHPKKPLVEGALPNLRARAFTSYDAVDPTKLREVPMRLTTVWFFPHAERGVMLFQGLAECREDDGSDIALLVGALERNGETKSNEHYAEAIARRMDPVNGALFSLRDSELLPANLAASDPDFDATKSEFEVEGLAGAATRRGAVMKIEAARVDLKSKGFDPDKLGVKVPPPMVKPTLEQMPDFLIAKRKEALNAQVNAILDANEQVGQAMAKAKAQGIDLAAQAHRGPPTYRANEHLAQLQAAVPPGTKLPDGKPAVDPGTLKPKLMQLEMVQRQNYLATAHTQPPAKPMPPERAKRMRADVAEGHAKKQSFLGVDLTGADLSGLDLSGADFSGAWLEGVNLQGAKLDGTCFAYAVLAHANLEGVTGSKAEFTGANLGKSNLKTARLTDCDFTKTIFADTSMAETDFRNSRLDQVNLMGATFGRADWRGIKASGFMLRKADFKDVVLHNAELLQPAFIECKLGGTDFSRALLDRATFVTCEAEGVRFLQTRMKGTVFAEKCKLSKADFSQADLSGSNLRAGAFPGAVLRGARLDQADLSDADLSKADLTGASARGALAIRTNFRGAKLAEVNFMDAILQRADLCGADAHDINLFGADLSRVAMDKDTRLGGAMLKRARTHPRRQAAPAGEGTA